MTKEQKYQMLKPKTFEEYMGYVFMSEVPEEAGDKETFDDNLWNWLQTKDAPWTMELVEKYEAKTF